MAGDPPVVSLAAASGAVEAVEDLRPEAVETVTAAIYRQLGEQLAPFGERGKSQCRQDLDGHLDYLVGSLVAGHATPFGDYLAWLRSVLAARAVPLDSLDLSVDLLREFFRERLAPEPFEAVAGLLAAGKEALAAPEAAGGSFRPPGQPQAVPPAATELAGLLVAGDRAGARALVASRSEQDGYLAVAAGMVLPAMQRVGEMWQNREISVAQEHLATAHVQRLLTEAFVQGPFAPGNGRRALFACVPGNHHEVGLRIAADAFELAGWHTEYLGADTPIPDLIERVGQFQPHCVGLSVALIRQLPQLKEAVEQLRTAFGSDCPRLVAGGVGLDRVPGVAERLGLDAYYSDPQAALEAPS